MPARGTSVAWKITHRARRDRAKWSRSCKLAGNCCADRDDQPGPLFTTRTGERLDRVQVFKILQRVAAQANTHRPAGERIEVSPHVLRHTFLRKLAEEKGVHYAKEASGHRSDRYIWRYVKPDAQSLADAVDKLA